MLIVHCMDSLLCGLCTVWVYGQSIVWIVQCMDSLLCGLCTPWTVYCVDCALYGQSIVWIVLYRDNPWWWLMHCMDNLLCGLCTPGTCVECVRVERVLHGKYICGVCATRKVRMWSVCYTESTCMECALHRPEMAYRLAQLLCMQNYEAAVWTVATPHWSLPAKSTVGCIPSRHQISNSCHGWLRSFLTQISEHTVIHFDCLSWVLKHHTNTGTEEIVRQVGL